MAFRFEILRATGLGRSVTRLWSRFGSVVSSPPDKQPLQAAPATERAAQLVSPPPTPLPPPPPTPPKLEDQLYEIVVAVGPFAEAAAHTKELVSHLQFRRAVELLADPAVGLVTVADYAFGHSWILSCAALLALKERNDGASMLRKVIQRFDQFSVWQMQFALGFLASSAPPALASAPLIGFNAWWNDKPIVHHIFADYFEALGEAADSAIDTDLQALPSATQDRIKDFLTHVRHPLANEIGEQLGAAPPAAKPQTDFLATLGRAWNEDGSASIVLEPQSWGDDLTTAARAMERKPVRSLLVSGEPLVGKTSFLRLLADRLRKQGWRVFEASGTDLQAGQKYIGELEGRIRQAIQELDVGKKIIWYVPDLLHLALSGTHSGQSASMLDQILPALSSGKVLIWTEASPKNAARLLQLRPALRRLLEVVRLAALSERDSRVLAQRLGTRLAADRGLGQEPHWTNTAVDVAQQYLSSSSLPGSALAIIKVTALNKDRGQAHLLTGHDVLQTVAQVTGLPLSILDGSERLNLTAVREHFTSRVLGQPNAVSSVVERIAMLKSGLNDPGKPIAVFLFAGPTGTGKTELAKVVAEYLFGSVDRMIRLDMSEFQTQDAITKILGGINQPIEIETLVSRVRKQPFSLVLLDEFEKSHPQIWDLFLQVFDEGRLTDAVGQTADFRHCLIILTTNLGATQHQGHGLGFAPSQNAFTNEQILRAIGQTFRPEFQNRLDKVIVFQPLTRELMRGILKKELSRLFERRGLKDRAWAVEWEGSAIEFLLEKGFSADMGARPLKRAIDQYVVAPLAETIVERRFPTGDQFVFMRRDGDALSADFVDPDGPEDQKLALNGASSSAALAAINLPSLTEMMRAPVGSGAEISALLEAEQRIDGRLASADWTRAKAALAAEMNNAEFWSRPERFVTLSKFELMDRLEVAADTAHSLQSRLVRSTNGKIRNARELVARLALQFHLIDAGLRDLDDVSPVEVAILVEPAFDSTAADRISTENWRAAIVDMYAHWAKKRHMRIVEIEDIPAPGFRVQIISGFGAHRTLMREVGLHVLEKGDSAHGSARATARVVLTELPQGNLSKAKIRQALASSFDKTERSAAVVRRYRRQPSPLVRNADGSTRSGKVEEVLGGEFDILL